MKVDIKELEKRFKVTSEQLGQWADACERGEYPGTPSGNILIGRPLMFGEQLKPVTFKETPKTIAAIDKKAASRGQSRSDYLRYLVDKDLLESDDGMRDEYDFSVSQKNPYVEKLKRL
jgi:hypothetical protein